VIPRGTIVIGDWITETMPFIAAQLQINKIVIGGEEFDFLADSEFFCTMTKYNRSEVHNANVVQGILTYLSTANVPRRIVNTRCQTTVLADEIERGELITYVNIKTIEIPVTLLEDFAV
jgi:hypothetical protein